jgi:hypothetical protein
LEKKRMEHYEKMSKEEVVKLITSTDSKVNYSLEILEKDIQLGFQLNQDGTINLWNYTAWLQDKRYLTVRQNRSTEIKSKITNNNINIDLTCVSVKEMCGFLRDRNTLGVIFNYDGNISEIWRENKTSLASENDEKKINVFKFIAFLANVRNRKEDTSKRSYEQRKEAELERQLQQSLSARDIGELPEVVNPARKEVCKYDFKLFCEYYFQNTFQLEWSNDHLRIISKIENSVLNGGLFALALPRGSGKTSLCEISAIWCMVYGHIEFVALIGATESAAQEMLSSVKTEIETNEILAEDFPEVCYPIEKLGGISNRCAGQLYKGVRTRITWTSDELVLPTIEGSAASGVVVRVAGLTGRVRGMKFKRPDGKTVRPKLVIVDDPQTNESANSIEQCRKRVRVLAGDILGLAGPGQKISGLMPCTVIRPGDMADQILDRSTHPEWNGERTKLIYAFPENIPLWEEYAEIRANCLREHGDIHLATEFYKENQAEMDKGAVPAWPARYNKDEISAIQNAMNLKIQDEVAFMAEYQNEPLADKSDEDILMSVDEICQQLNGLKKTIVPLECTKVTMFVDVQKTLLYYCVCAWSDEFTGAVIDYGAWPDQKRTRFTLHDASPTIQDVIKGGFEGQLYKAFESLINEKMQTAYLREDGAEMHIERAMIDANWGLSTDTVYQFCRQSEYSGIVLPAHGRYIGASSRSMTEYKKKKGERLGFNWFMPAVAGKRAIRHVVFDTNFWKSFIHTRLGVLKGDKGSLTLWGRSPLAHQCFAEHLTAEYRVKTVGLGREVDEWKLRPDKSDNHWLDCLAGCAVGASMQGSTLSEFFHITRKDKIKLSEKNKNFYNNTKNDVSQVNENISEEEKNQERKPLKLSDLQKRRR